MFQVPPGQRVNRCWRALTGPVTGSGSLRRARPGPGRRFAALPLGYGCLLRSAGSVCWGRRRGRAPTSESALSWRWASRPRSGSERPAPQDVGVPLDDTSPTLPAPRPAHPPAVHGVGVWAGRVEGFGCTLGSAPVEPGHGRWGVAALVGCRSRFDASPIGMSNWSSDSSGLSWS